MNSMSFNRNSSVITRMSAHGSTLSDEWTMSSSSNARITWIMPSTALMWERKAFPRPSPLCAPWMSPAMSTTLRYGLTSDLGLCFSTSQSNRSSLTGHRVSLGSMVQNGKFAASAWCDFDKELYKVDFPTFGNPTSPTFKLVENFPSIQGSFFFSATAFFGDIGECFTQLE